jgi:hypothetical protein
MFAVRATASAAEGQRLSPVGDAEQEYASDSSGLRGKAHRTQGRQVDSQHVKMTNFEDVRDLSAATDSMDRVPKSIEPRR